MRKTNRSEFWAVYRRTMIHHKKRFETNAVCEQAEWDAMELAEPGVHALIRGRITTEEEAEKLARGISGDDYRRRSSSRMTS